MQLLNQSGLLFIAALCIGLCTYVLLRSVIRRRSARAFGKTFEVAWVAKAIKDLGRLPLRLTANVALRGLGDVDLFVEQLNRDGSVRARVVVEIKSFVYWKSYFFGMFLGRRERDAIAQVERLTLRLRADRAVVWIPQGRLSVLQRTFGVNRNKAVHIVAGDTKCLAAVLMN